MNKDGSARGMLECPFVDLINLGKYRLLKSRMKQRKKSIKYIEYGLIWCQIRLVVQKLSMDRRFD